MNKKYRKLIRLVLFILLSMFIYTEAIYLGNILKLHYNSVSIRIDDENSLITIKAIEKALENEKDKEKEVPEVTIWNSNKKNKIYSKDIYNDDAINTDYIGNVQDNIKKIKVQTYEVYGKCQQAYPMELYCGSFLIKDDIYGCIVDENTCYDLFGTKNVVGNPIVLNEKIYYIRGVAKIDNPSIIVQVDDEKYKFSNIEIVYSNDERGKEFAEKFMLENGLGEDYVIYDCEFYVKLVEKAVKIPIWIIAIFFIKKFLEIIYVNIGELKNNEDKKISIINIFLCSLIVILIIYVSKFEFYYPLRMIPSKWSDFKFWIDKIDEVKLLIYKFTYTFPYPRDILLIKNLKMVILCIILSCINVVVLLKHRKYLHIFYKDKEILL